MKDISLITEELSLKEGMYVQKGQSIFSIYNPDRAWAILNIYGENQALVKAGNAVRVISGNCAHKRFQGNDRFYRTLLSEGK